jgi:hypothetical protein
MTIQGQVLKIAYTRGDRATKPGGIILRKIGEEFVAHHFSRNPGSLEPVEFFWGRYCNNSADGSAAFYAKLDRVMAETITKIQILHDGI